VADAAQVLLLMLETDDPAFEAPPSAGPALHQRMPRRHPQRGARPLEALNALPAPDAHATLTGLLKRHGLR
jgi:hypothetical protein